MPKSNQKFLPNLLSSVVVAVTAFGTLILVSLPLLPLINHQPEKVLGSTKITVNKKLVSFGPNFDREFFLRFKAQTQITQEQPITTVEETLAVETPKPTPKPVPTATTNTPTPPKPQGIEELLVQMTNDARAKNALAPLQINSQLMKLATQRSTDMATKNYFSHTSPTGETAFTLLKINGINYKTAAENIGRNNYSMDKTAQMVFDGWMNSTGHRNNILSGKFSQIGIGMATNSNGMKYYTQIFIGN